MNQVHFQAPTLTKLNKIILISAGVFFLAGSILKAIGAVSLVHLLGLSADGLFHGLIYKLITYPLIEMELMTFIFNGLIIWFIGSELELSWGIKIYLRFLLFTVIGAGLFFSLLNLVFFFGTPPYFASLHGLSGINFALLIAYSLLYPDRQMVFMMIFPMKAKTFCWILVFIEAYLAVFNSLQSSWGHLLAMGMSFLLINFQSNPVIKLALQGTWPLRPKSKKQTHLRVVKDDDQKPPRYWQ